jgi:hypothetical protein
VVLSATIDEVNKPLVEAIVAHLRQISRDTSLTLQRIEAGSVRLILEGSQKGFTLLSTLFSTGQLPMILGLAVQDVYSEQGTEQKIRLQVPPKEVETPLENREELATSSEEGLTNNRVSENEKRRRIRNYFKAAKLKWIFVLFIIGCILSSYSSTIIMGLVFLAVAGIRLYFEIKPLIDAPSEGIIDAWINDDFRYLKKRSLEILNIDESELIRDSIVICTPLLWETAGIPITEINWRKGLDRRIRFSINTVIILHLTENRLNSYQCEYNFMRGIPLRESYDCYLYRDVVSVSVRNEPTNYTLPNGTQMRHAEFFKITLSSGYTMQALVNSEALRQFTSGVIEDFGVSHAVRVLRKVLVEKKV